MQQNDVTVKLKLSKFWHPNKHMTRHAPWFFLRPGTI